MVSYHFSKCRIAVESIRFRLHEIELSARNVNLPSDRGLTFLSPHQRSPNYRGARDRREFREVLCDFGSLRSTVNDDNAK